MLDMEFLFLPAEKSREKSTIECGSHRAANLDLLHSLLEGVAKDPQCILDLLLRHHQRWNPADDIIVCATG